jgi:hypothetical protein
MFTIKLYYDIDSYNVICSPHYNIRTFNTDEGFVTEITVYKDMTTQDGTTYRVAKDISVPHWNYAYIENSSGKTIDHIKH